MVSAENQRPQNAAARRQKQETILLDSRPRPAQFVHTL
jgi:hypothetical protein